MCVCQWKGVDCSAESYITASPSAVICLTQRDGRDSAANHGDADKRRKRQRDESQIMCREGGKKPWARISAPRLQRDDRDQKRRVQGWGCHFAGRRLHQKAVATSQSNKLPGVKEKNQWNCTFHRFRN